MEFKTIALNVIVTNLVSFALADDRIKKEVLTPEQT
jgi:hypothetical protein